MSFNPFVAPTRIRCQLEDHALVLFHPEDLAHHRESAPGWWRVREQVLPELAGGRLAMLVTGGGDGADVEVTDSDDALPDGEVRKRQRFHVDVTKGALFLGPASALPSLAAPDGDVDGDGGWIELLPGEYVIEVELLRTGHRYRLRFTPAADAPRPLDRIPHVGPVDAAWDEYVVRTEAVEGLLDAGVRANASRQQRLVALAAGHDLYELDQDSGELRLRRDGRTILRRRFHAIGTYGTRSRTWKWAWANASLASPLRTLVEEVRLQGDRCGARWLVEPDLPVPEADAWRLASVATEVMGLVGWYPVPYEGGVLVVGVEPESALSLAEADAEPWSDGTTLPTPAN